MNDDDKLRCRQFTQACAGAVFVGARAEREGTTLLFRTPEKDIEVLVPGLHLSKGFEVREFFDKGIA